VTCIKQFGMVFIILCVWQEFFQFDNFLSLTLNTTKFLLLPQLLKKQLISVYKYVYIYIKGKKKIPRRKLINPLIIIVITIVITTVITTASYCCFMSHSLHYQYCYCYYDTFTSFMIKLILLLMLYYCCWCYCH